ncbi:hypothetical protein [Bifidobacterium cuniculi]|uniref:Uncharacterized protein n=1 Tax=Bifidobacterium cuniculi TaxID=1688 RepID=A0A087B555_9BIFI|nr:hypothetical protein [Bifidobacterium cuniculi]KFI66155.1 hypothetical protein BCUN_0662 [Bifidobacterium cuniculi]
MTQAGAVRQSQEDKRVGEPQKPWWWTLLVQLVAYAGLVALACIPGSGNTTSATFSFTAFAVAVMLVLFEFFSPLRDLAAGRVIAVVLGLCAMVAASTPFVGTLVFEVAGRDHDLSGAAVVCAGWLAAAATLLTVLVVGGFLRQMLRRDRPDMIVQMGHMDLDGVAAVCASGWCFLPVMFHEASAPDAARMAVLAAVAVVAVLLAWVGRQWVSDARPLDGARCTWIGFGLLSVMLTGGAVGVAALVMWLV